MIRDHILVVEDDPEVRAGILALLEDEFPDFSIEAVESAEQAKKTLRKCRARDLLTRVVIVDEKLGTGERGSQLLKYIERYYPGIRKIMLEAQANREDISRALNEGKLDKYIHKLDFKKDHGLLFNAIRDSLSEGEGVLYDAVIETLREAESQDDEDAAILMAGPRQIPAISSPGHSPANDAWSQAYEAVYQASIQCLFESGGLPSRNRED